jgi:hypothetical protein
MSYGPLLACFYMAYELMVFTFSDGERMGEGQETAQDSKKPKIFLKKAFANPL